MEYAQNNQVPQPIVSKQSVREIGGHRVDVVTYGFADKIVILVSRDGNLGKMYNVPLISSAAPQLFSFDNSFNDGDVFSLLPLNRLTPIPMLGASSDDIEGRIYAAQIASLICRQSPEERRLVVIGMAHAHNPSDTITTSSRMEFIDILNLVGKCRVW
ncbi:hypothetical protein V1512DRAFT_249620 [Lipomyces arxii]|uniref:uncharacterized protein n=1 Tax=Lipomyces arxii TaxID=56418 RepID=UPI0034CE87DA